MMYSVGIRKRKNLLSILSLGIVLCAQYANAASAENLFVRVLSSTPGVREVVSLGDDFYVTTRNVGSGFHAFSGAMCGGYAAAKNAARVADGRQMPPFPAKEDIEAEQKRVMHPLERGGETSASQFEQAIRQVMRYYMGYVRNETGMKQGLESLERIASKIEDLHANNMHELMRVHEAQHLLQACRLFTMSSIERRETSAQTLCLRSDYPDPDPSLTVLAIEKRGDTPFLYWM